MRLKEGSDRFGADRIYLYLEMDSLSEEGVAQGEAVPTAGKSVFKPSGTLSAPRQKKRWKKRDLAESFWPETSWTASMCRRRIS